MTEQTQPSDEPGVLTFLGHWMVSQHAHHGHQQLIDSAFHFFLTRLAYEEDLDTERVEELSAEAYTIFVEGTLTTYRSWLREIDAEVDPEQWAANGVVTREQFDEMVEDLVHSLERYGVL